MRLSSFRALLLALAMVAQAIASGASLAHAALLSPEHTLSEPCHEHHAHEQSAPAAPAEKSSHHHNCQSCCLCAEPWHVWSADWTHDAAAPVGYALIDFGATDLSPPPARLARSHGARAPPAARA